MRQDTKEVDTCSFVDLKMKTLLYFISCLTIVCSCSSPCQLYKLYGKCEKTHFFLMSVNFSADVLNFIPQSNCSVPIVEPNKSSKCNDIHLQKLQSDIIYSMPLCHGFYGIIGSSKDHLEEMFYGLRNSQLGTSYIVSVYHSEGGQSFLGLGNPNNTEVLVDINMEHLGNDCKYCKRRIKTVKLKQYEAKTISCRCDMTGASINASSEIIAYAASLTSTPQNKRQQFFVEQLIPTAFWGTIYIVMPSGNNPYGEIIIITAAQNNTVVHIHGYDYVILPNRYHKIRRRVDGKEPIIIQSSKPVSVMQLILNKSKAAMVYLLPISITTDPKNMVRSFNYAHAISNGINPGLNSHLEKSEDFPDNRSVGCIVYKDTGPHLWATYCGFVPKTQTEAKGPEQTENICEDIHNPSNCYAALLKEKKLPFPDGACCEKQEEGGVKTSGNFFAITPEIYLRGQRILGISFCKITEDDLNIQFYYRYSNDTGWTRGHGSSPDLVFLPRHSSNVVFIHSNATISLTCKYESNTSSNPFIVPPLTIIGKKYTTALPPCPRDSSHCTKKCVITRLFNDTVLTISNNTSQKDYHFSSDILEVEEIDTGSQIISNKKVSVLCATISKDTSLVLYQFPDAYVGSEFKVLKTEEMKESLFIMSTESNTVLNIHSFNDGIFQYSGQTKQVGPGKINKTLHNVYKRHKLLLHSGQTEKIGLDNIYALSISSNKPVLVVAYVEYNNDTNIHSNSPYNNSSFNFVYVPTEQNITRSIHNAKIWKNISNEKYVPLTNSGWPLHFKLSTRQKPLKVSFPVAGDEVDNDQDGLVDEEWCRLVPNDSQEEVIYDMDLDGSINEDCIVKCMKGQEFNSKTKNCDPCKLGYYKNVTGNDINCYRCQSNYTTRKNGSEDISDCKLANCVCPCNMVHPVKNYTSAELAQIIQKMKKELEVNKEKLSSNIRKRISVMDNRPSARSLGVFGVVIITAIFAALIAIDIIILKEHFLLLVDNLRNVFARN